MLKLLSQVLQNSWYLVAEMAPYLMLGFCAAALLQLLIRPEWVRKQLGNKTLGSIIKAALLGVPMPLCSCSVIPVSASLRKSGASKGATASFLSSTPQTGVDSILATYALMGGFFTLVRVLVAFISGLACGLLVELCSKSRRATAISSPLIGNLQAVHPSEASGHRGRLGQPTLRHIQSDSKGGWRQALQHGFITLPADLSRALGIGILIAGIITTLIPDSWLSESWGSGWLGFLLATAISMPLYICATASIPMAYALLTAGLSPGATLVFLIAGPATNTTTIAAAWNMLGQKATLIYAASLICVAWLSGWAFNASLSLDASRSRIHLHEATAPLWWQHLSGVAFVGLLILASWRVKRSTPKKSCCQQA
ncbi:MAG: SO_0444 family Cu/Zn efflux transporter [Opitutales bacterium]